ncbi:MAG: peptidylprolyl isomerase [Clostridia bacterium]|nr:peptidylprolyl isomerase [Clostridia bacterium]
MKKRLISLLLALCLTAVSFAALAEAAENTETAEPAEVTEAAEPQLLATINGTEIYDNDSDLQYWISYYMYQLSSSGYDTTNPDLLSDVNKYSLYNTLNFAVLRQKASELGLADFTDEEIAAMEAEARESWTSVLENYETNYFSITDESSEEDRTAARADALAMLEGMGYTEESYVAEMVDGSVTNELIGRVQKYASEGLAVTDDEVVAYYDELAQEDEEQFKEDVSSYEFMTQYYGQDSYYVPEGYRGIVHILLKVDQELLDAWKDLTARFEEQQADTAEDGADTAEATADPEATPEPTEEPVTQDMVDAARKAILDSVSATVDEIMAKYNEGTSFEDLIREYGTDPGMQDEATVAEGYHIHPDSILYDSDFVKGAMGLEKIGDVSEPIVSQFGVHILQYLKDIPGGVMELTDSLKEELRDALLQEKQQDAFTSLLDQWMAESDIQYTEAGEAWKLDEDAAAEDAAAEEPAAEEPAE